MKKFALLTIALMLVSMVGCGGDESTIKSMVQDFADGMNAGDGTKVAAMMYFETEEQRSAAAAALSGFKGSVDKLAAANPPKKMIENLEIKSVKIEGETATAEISSTSNRIAMNGEIESKVEPETLKFKKVDGKWYLTRQFLEKFFGKIDVEADESQLNIQARS